MLIFHSSYVRFSIENFTEIASVFTTKLMFSTCVFLSGNFLRLKEDGIRIALQELSQQHYNEDDVIAELVAMVTDISRTRQAVPQVTALYKLSELNRQAKERAQSAQRSWVRPPTYDPSTRQMGVVMHDSLQVHSINNFSQDSSPEDWV